MTPPEARRGEPGNADDLQRRRREIGRGLTRSHYAVVVATLLVGLLTMIAVWLSREAERRAGDAQAERRRAEANAANAARASDRLLQIGIQFATLKRNSRQPGQRTKTLEIIREAAAWQPSRELRDEALSALLLPDFGTNLTWHEESGHEMAAAYDANFEHFILNNDRGRAIVRRADGATLMDGKGFGLTTTFWQFSPDGRLAAMSFRNGPIAVWDLRRTNLVARFPSNAAQWAEPPFDFSPHRKSLWLLTPTDSLTEYVIDGGEAVTTIPLEPFARLIRLSPSGKLAAVAFGESGHPNGRMEIWDLAARSRRAALNLTNDIWRLAWQPGEERLAIGGGGGLFLWDIGAANAEVLRPDCAITVIFFSADGDLLFTGGWDIPSEIWNTRSWKAILQTTEVGHLQISADQTRLAVTKGRVGYGVQQYLAPTGVRSWPGPPLLGQARGSADVDPQERWLLNAFVGGWLVRDAQSGRELARVELTNTLAASFSADGSKVLAWTTSGLWRWPVALDGESSLAVGKAQTVWKSGETQVSGGAFAAGGRYATCSQDGLVTVVDATREALAVQFRLQRRRDNVLLLHPDKRWLLTAYHNQHGIDWYDAHSGKFVRRFAAEGFANPVFDPRTGDLFTCTATEHTQWNPQTGQRERTTPWGVAAPYQSFIAFDPNGRLALTTFPPTGLQLHDLRTGRDFATLDFRDTEAVFQAHWSRDGRRIFLFGNDGGITRLDLSALRVELDRLGLNWPDDDPSREFAKRPELVQTGLKSAPATLGLGQPARLVWLVLAGLVIAIAIGFYILRYQRGLFAGYLETEKLAEQRAADLRHAQAALMHREKMEALGTMAAGVAHDFNNLLSVIRLSNELIEEQVRPAGVVRENFNAIQQAVQRGRGIVNSMLGYARDDGQPQWLAPGALISDAVAMLSKPFLGGLVLQIESDPATPDVLVRKARIGQMLLNLIINAAEAMNGRGRLRLTVREIREASGCVLPPRAAGSYVELSVTDSGPGIAVEIQPRIFEPFFTTKTKSAQRGTGLGLSMLYAMAKEDGVGVAVTSESGRGATFRLLLPVDLPAEAGTTCPLRAAPEAKKTGAENE
jgi:signal transduction histidine kinase